MAKKEAAYYGQPLFVGFLARIRKVDHQHLQSNQHHC